MKIIWAINRTTSCKRLYVVGTILGIVIVAACYFFIEMERSSNIIAFRTATTNLANGMAQQTSKWFEVIDLTLKEVQGELLSIQDPVPENIKAVMHSAAISTLLADLQKHLSDVDVLAVVDTRGMIVSSSRELTSSDLDVSASDFYQHFIYGDDDGVFVSVPSKGQNNGKWTTVLARRIADRRGTLVGLVFGKIPLNNLEEFYHVAVPFERNILVLRKDGVVLVYYPHQDQIIGKKVPDHAPWHSIVAQGGGAYNSESYFDMTPVISVVRPLNNVPIVVEAAVKETIALSGWYRERINIIISGIITIICMILLLLFLAAHFRRLEYSEKMLSEKNIQLETARLQFEAAISNISQGLCFFDRGHKLVVCNQKFGEIYNLPSGITRPGMSLAEFVDHCLAAGSIPNVTSPEYLATLQGIAQSREPSHLVIELKNGRSIAVEQKAMPDGGWVATHEDITERQKMENNLKRVNEDLRILSNKDGLTGVANRRYFDHYFDTVWSKAKRSGTSIGLLMIDIDFFKRYNDNYGHAGGDSCLKAVVEAITRVIRHPPDLVARYGGEEFVCLLPGADVSVTATVGQRVLKEVQDYCLPHAFSEVADHVTVSIGGTSMAPEGDLPPGALVETADRLLYRAKAGGRNRMVIE
jgi:diguanylate cyclase (GGDEF)-like protein